MCMSVHVTLLLCPIQTHYCLLLGLRGPEFDGLQCQFKMSVGQQIGSCSKSIAKANNALFICTRNDVANLSQLGNCAMYYPSLYCGHCYMVFKYLNRKTSQRKETDVIICTLFDYRAWLSLCSRGVKHAHVSRCNIHSEE
jgi:hypothetical protein